LIFEWTLRLDFLDEKLMEKKASYLCRFHWQITETKYDLRRVASGLLARFGSIY
jgi:hypothetical protein